MKIEVTKLGDGRLYIAGETYVNEKDNEKLKEALKIAMSYWQPESEDDGNFEQEEYDKYQQCNKILYSL